ncbi:MAG: OadG family protein [Synergistaceae bacterium]|nr:OadG family protein [Synergistaceae bacterium]
MQHFEGISGAISVSIVAFSIVFGVLLILTAVIYTMKVFAGSGGKPSGGEGAKTAGAGAAPAPAAKAAPLAASAQPQAKIVAAITAAILAMTGGRGRILSIQPAVAGAQCGAPFSTWRVSGIVGLVNNRLSRNWNQR